MAVAGFATFLLLEGSTHEKFRVLEKAGAEDQCAALSAVIILRSLQARKYVSSFSRQSNMPVAQHGMGI